MSVKIKTAFAFASAAAALGLTLSSPAIADTGLKVGYVDLQRALSESEAGKTAEGKFQEEVKKARGGIDSKKKEYDALQEAVKKQKDSLSAKALAEKEEKLMSMEKDLKRTIQDGEDALRRKNAQLVGDLVKKLREIVNQIGKDDGYTMIFEKGTQSPVLFADQSIDITEKVVKKFNSEK